MKALASFEMPICVGHVGAEDYPVKELFDWDLHIPLSQTGFDGVQSDT